MRTAERIVKLGYPRLFHQAPNRFIKSHSKCGNECGFDFSKKVNLSFENKEINDLIGSGGGTRTPDTRIMIPLL